MEEYALEPWLMRLRMSAAHCPPLLQHNHIPHLIINGGVCSRAVVDEKRRGVMWSRGDFLISRNSL
jgi:hypothetical protein